MAKYVGDSCHADTTLQEFTLFPELPIELRLQIWEKALLPRFINIDDLSGDRGPAILRVNRESRSVSRSKYTDFRATRVCDNEKVGFFINPSIDIYNVCKFGDGDHNRWQIVALLNIISCRYPPWLNHAQRIAISLTSETHGGYPNGFLEQSWRQLNKQFPELKELVIVMDSEVDVRLEELVEIPRSPSKLGRMVDRFQDSLEKAKEEQGLCKFMTLTFMKDKKASVEREGPARGLRAWEKPLLSQTYGTKRSRYAR